MIEIQGERYKAIGDLVLKRQKDNKVFRTKSPMTFIVQEDAEKNKTVLKLKFNNYYDLIDPYVYTLIAYLQTKDNHIHVIYIDTISPIKEEHAEANTIKFEVLQIEQFPYQMLMSNNKDNYYTQKINAKTTITTTQQ